MNLFYKAVGSGFGPTAIALRRGNGGRRNRTRTCDPRLVRPMLSQLSYPPKSRGRAPWRPAPHPIQGDSYLSSARPIRTRRTVKRLSQANEPPYPRICRPRIPGAAHRARVCTGRWLSGSSQARAWVSTWSMCSTGTSSTVLSTRAGISLISFSLSLGISTWDDLGPMGGQDLFASARRWAAPGRAG